jgi:hypothetical protein
MTRYVECMQMRSYVLRRAMFGYDAFAGIFAGIEPV